MVLKTSAVYLELHNCIFRQGISQSFVLIDPGNNLLLVAATTCHTDFVSSYATPISFVLRFTKRQLSNVHSTTRSHTTEFPFTRSTRGTSRKGALQGLEPWSVFFVATVGRVRAFLLGGGDKSPSKVREPK